MPEFSVTQATVEFAIFLTLGLAVNGQLRTGVGGGFQLADTLVGQLDTTLPS